MNGILLIDKEANWTSSDVVAKLRGVLRERRIGHSGTLDPMATGLLALFIGRATRAAEFAESRSKRYMAGLRLGLSTDTQDITGRVLRRSEQSVTKTELESVLENFRGEISQVPPMYSAIKKGGKKLYEIARRGGSVEREPRQLTIYELKLLGGDGADFILDVSCSKGTYIRTLCNDIGEALGCGGCMSSLRRLRVGDYSVENAYTVSQVEEAAAAGRAEELLLPVDSLFSGAGAVTVDREQEQAVRNGNNVKFRQTFSGQVRLYSEKGEFLALAEQTDGGPHIIKSFFEV